MSLVSISMKWGDSTTLGVVLYIISIKGLTQRLLQSMSVTRNPSSRPALIVINRDAEACGDALVSDSERIISFLLQHRRVGSCLAGSGPQG